MIRTRIDRSAIGVLFDAVVAHSVAKLNVRNPIVPEAVSSKSDPVSRHAAWA